LFKFIIFPKESGFGTCHFGGCQRFVEPVSSLFLINLKPFATLSQKLCKHNGLLGNYQKIGFRAFKNIGYALERY